MKLIKSDGPNCLAACAAMVTDTTLADVFRGIGHDGSEVWLPGAPYPMSRRGFCPPEIVAYAYDKGVGLIEWPRVWLWVRQETQKMIEKTEQDFLQKIIEAKTAILCGMGAETEHAVVFHEMQIYDPRGSVYPYAEMEQNYFYSPYAAFLVRRFAI